MVAVIKTGHSIHRILNYNENKVKAGVAECIGAENYPIDPDKMSLTMKLNRFLKQMELNENVKRNSVHISLNFDVSESHLSQEKLLSIAEDYMEKIGFGKQPFLVYQHYDAGHPHIHLVTTNIEADGKRIDLHHLGIRKSEPARKAIEKEFGLVAAEAQKKQENYLLKPISVSKAIYGKSQTKMAIQNVLEAVLGQYKYASLPELNAVLKQYNVIAERGTEDSKVYQTGGLLYRILDAAGNPIGVPIKASLFYNKPTLKFLERKFKENEPKRMPYKTRIRNAIDMALLVKKITVQALMKELEKQGIHTALRTNETGIVYGVTYVDHQTKCVFNGSALGKQYSAKAIQERCAFEPDLLTHPAQKPIGLQPQATASAAETKAHQNDLQTAHTSKGTETVLDVLMQPEQAADYVPGQLKKNKKKRKRKNQNNNQ
ncbi:relaxase/mobilization nuclease domain-containing protein [Pedobacter sp. ISL-68]|uniref:relaxase/mobilization nuclease domain-containing protein n=1 Tax=unclassified Pedobacter TaxID=2628915 RepID=UPI001BE914B5|nr:MULTISPECIES: relaxase/mobilization nuclease domain-containing protein [unclassified Pedobacter]MBT2564693.1 relaxase/mobilization nuclease domain-containing protein [Pedobacter sp. ISL-64]MBT2592418.1 relaxase/mobilization nuclease domain-containing protein [Pedobacter sp. ISL-68]